MAEEISTSFAAISKYVRAHNIAEFFEVRRCEVRVRPVTTMDVFVDTLKIQQQRIEKLLLHRTHTVTATDTTMFMVLSSAV